MAITMWPRNEKERNYEERRARGQESPEEDVEHDRSIPLYPEGPLGLPPPSSGAQDRGDLQLPELDSNKLHHIFNDPDHGLDSLVTKFGSPEAAFDAIARAARDAVRSQGIIGQYEIQVEVGGYQVTVRGRVHNGIVDIGTVLIPWAR
jgi:hypothetical protein